MASLMLSIVLLTVKRNELVNVLDLVTHIVKMKRENCLSLKNLQVSHLSWWVQVKFCEAHL